VIVEDDVRQRYLDSIDWLEELSPVAFNFPNTLRRSSSRRPRRDPERGPAALAILECSTRTPKSIQRAPPPSEGLAVTSSA
jgi:hypothetical protein